MRTGLVSANFFCRPGQLVERIIIGTWALVAVKTQQASNYYYDHVKSSQTHNTPEVIDQECHHGGQKGTVQQQNVRTGAEASTILLHAK